ncbi:MAG TPA: AMP-binding protein [Gemmatimonadaceae bacterium]|nr:AMP-binding protein [Gemmatimonadaceae bacterium]
MQHNVAHLLSSAAARRPDHLAIEDPTAPDGRCSYAELQALAAGFVAAYRARGLQRGDRVAILLDRGAAAAAAILAAHAEGAIAVVINERLRVRQVEHILADCAPAVLVSSEEMLARAALPRTQVPPLLEPLSVAPGGEFAPQVVQPQDPAQIIYTSGSTGLPKGVVHTHGSVAAGVATTHRYLMLRSDDRVASLLAFSAVYGLNQLLCSIAVGSTLVIERAVFPADLVQALRADQISIAAGVPPLWSQLVGVEAFQLPIPSLRQMQNAGGHLPAETAKRLRAAQPQAELVLQYGMTETWRGSYLPPEEFDRRPGSMGRAVPGAELLVTREDGTLCDVDEVGELVHLGPTVAAGYWGGRGDAQQVFRPHPARPGVPAVHSGDYVKRDADGFLYYVGRRDRVIKTQGLKVGPDEVADALLHSGQLSEVVVAGEADAERGQRIVAYVVLAPGGTLAALRKHARAELPPHMQPARFVERSELPRLASGKYDVEGLLRGE